MTFRLLTLTALVAGSSFATAGIIPSNHIFALSAGSSSQSTVNGIYRVNTVTGASTLVRSVSNLTSLNTRGANNGLAYDAATDTFFYKNGLNDLYKVTSTGETKLGRVRGLASATFYNGSYWYMDGTRLRKVNVGTFSDSLVGNLGSAVGGSYGDIASTSGGKLYGGSDKAFWSSVLPGGTGTTVIKNSATQLQLGFYGDSALYGIATDNDKVFSIDTATGATTHVSTAYDTANASNRLFFVDAASAPVPEPASMAALGIGLAALARRRRKNG